MAAGKGASPSVPWVQRAAAAVTQMLRHPLSAVFAAPVPRETPLYYDLISKPMDLGTLLTKLQTGKYGAPQEVFQDMAQIWANCRQYNEPSSEICGHAAQLEAAWAQLCPLAELQRLAAADSGDGGCGGAGGAAAAAAPAHTHTHTHAAQHSAPQAYAAAAPHAQGGATAQPQQQQAAVQMDAMVQVIARLRTCCEAWPFQEPVPREVPGYYEMIKHPVDLGTIWHRVNHHQYPDANHVHQDIVQMFNNCFAFNLDGDEVYELGRQLQDLYKRFCQERGLM